MQLNPPPGFIHSRIELFEKLKTEYDAKIAGNVNGPTNIRKARFIAHYEGVGCGS